MIQNFLSERPDPFGEGKLANVVTSKELESEVTDFLLSCYTEGEKSYENYRQQRLIDKGVKLFDRITKPRICNKASLKVKKVDILKEKLSDVHI